MRLRDHPTGCMFTKSKRGIRTFWPARTPLRSVLARRFIKRFSLFSYEKRLSIEAVDRPNYGYCIFQAARLASLLQYPKISVIEFGCGGGNGLLNAEMHINEVMKLFAVSIDLYGFDGGSGMPPQPTTAICRTTFGPAYMRWIAVL